MEDEEEQEDEVEGKENDNRNIEEQEEGRTWLIHLKLDVVGEVKLAVKLSFASLENGTRSIDILPHLP